MCLSETARWFISLIVQGLGSAATVAIAILAYLINRSTRYANHRPRMKVGLITSSSACSNRFTPDTPFDVSVNFVSYGGFPAKIIESHCQLYLAARLPMKRPYGYVEDGFEANNFFTLTGPLKTGSATGWLRNQTLSDDQIKSMLSGDTKLYVMGYVRYEDKEGQSRRTMFCRIYDPKEDRYIATADPDYEVEN